MLPADQAGSPLLEHSTLACPIRHAVDVDRVRLGCERLRPATGPTRRPAAPGCEPFPPPVARPVPAGETPSREQGVIASVRSLIGVPRARMSVSPSRPAAAAELIGGATSRRRIPAQHPSAPTAAGAPQRAGCNERRSIRRRAACAIAASAPSGEAGSRGDRHAVIADEPRRPAAVGRAPRGQLRQGGVRLELQQRSARLRPGRSASPRPSPGTARSSSLQVQ